MADKCPHFVGDFYVNVTARTVVTTEVGDADAAAHAAYADVCSVLFFSRPRSEGWPHHGRTFSIYPCPLSF